MLSSCVVLILSPSPGIKIKSRDIFPLQCWCCCIGASSSCYNTTAATAASTKQLLEKQLATEAIYVNDNFVVIEKEEVDCTYDVPAATRSEDLILIGESLSESFDVPRTRDSLSTIEEEHQVCP